MNPLIRLAVVFLLAVVSGGLSNAWLSRCPIPWVLDQTTSVRTNDTLRDRVRVTVERVQQAVASGGEVLLLDARSADEYAKAHIPGALSMPVGEVLNGALDVYALVPPETQVVVYCSDAECEDSGRLYDWLILMGYKHVQIFPGGMSLWEQVYPRQIQIGVATSDTPTFENGTGKWEEIELRNP